MSNYQLYAPIGLNAQNFGDFKNLLVQQAQDLMNPENIAGFATANAHEAYEPLPEPKPYMMRNPDVAGAYTRVLMWQAKGAAADDMNRKVALFMDVIPVPGVQKQYSYQPRQYILGPGAQCVIPYRMSCCPGLSAVACYKQQNGLTAALFESEKFTTPDHRDIFGVKSGRGGILIDHDGAILRHWQNHVMRVDHDCGSSPHIAVSARLGAFRPS